MHSHKSMLDYFSTAGFTKTYDQLKEEVPELVSPRYELYQIFLDVRIF
jgi:hypothetical protein